MTIYTQVAGTRPCQPLPSGTPAAPVEHRVDGPGAQLDGLIEAPQRLLQLALPSQRIATVAQRPAEAQSMNLPGTLTGRLSVCCTGGFLRTPHLPTMSGTQSALTLR